MIQCLFENTVSILSAFNIASVILIGLVIFLIYGGYSIFQRNLVVLDRYLALLCAISVLIFFAFSLVMHAYGGDMLWKIKMFLFAATGIAAVAFLTKKRLRNAALMFLTGGLYSSVGLLADSLHEACYASF